MRLPVAMTRSALPVPEEHRAQSVDSLSGANLDWSRVQVCWGRTLGRRPDQLDVKRNEAFTQPLAVGRARRRLFTSVLVWTG